MSDRFSKPAETRQQRMRAAGEALRRSERPGTSSLGERLGAIPRLIGAAATGRYPLMGKGRLALYALGAAYIVSPIDVVPEAFFLAFGLIDDLGVAAWVVTALLSEADRFLAWERSQTGDRTIDGDAHRAP